MAKGQAKRPSKSQLAAIATDNETRRIPQLLRDSPSLAAAVGKTVSYASLPDKTDFKPLEGGRRTRVAFREQDSLDCAAELVAKWGADKVAVLNMANALQPGGGHEGDLSGYLTGISGQEQALCRRSTLYKHINHPQFYPFGDEGGLFSEGVRVFRRGDAELCTMMPEEERFDVNVVSAAALDRRHFGRGKAPSYSSKDENEMFNKIKAVLRIAKTHHQHVLVLGAFGCGAFNNPPASVAQLFLRALTRTAEFKTAFHQVTFAIRDAQGSNWKAFTAEWKEIIEAQNADAGGHDAEPLEAGWGSDSEAEIVERPKKRKRDGGVEASPRKKTA